MQKHDARDGDPGRSFSSASLAASRLLLCATRLRNFSVGLFLFSGNFRAHVQHFGGRAICQEKLAIFGGVKSSHALESWRAHSAQLVIGMDDHPPKTRAMFVGEPVVQVCYRR